MRGSMVVAVRQNVFNQVPQALRAQMIPINRLQSIHVAPSVLPLAVNAQVPVQPPAQPPVQLVPTVQPPAHQPVALPVPLPAPLLVPPVQPPVALPVHQLLVPPVRPPSEDGDSDDSFHSAVIAPPLRRSVRVKERQSRPAAPPPSPPHTRSRAAKSKK